MFSFNVFREINIVPYFSAVYVFENNTENLLIKAYTNEGMGEMVRNE